MLVPIPTRNLDLSVEGFQTETREEVTAILLRLAPYLPPWCLYLRVIFIPESSDRDIANAEADPEYRQARILLRPLFLVEQSAEFKLNTLAHEVAHLLLWPLTDHMDFVIGEATEPGTSIRKHIESTVRLASESTTEDVARIILRALSL